MPRFTRHVRSAAIGLAAFTLFGAAVGLAGAQRPDAPPAPSDRPGPRGEAPFGGLRDEFAAKLAEKLGVSQEALWTAFRETMAEMRPQIQERMGQFRERMHERVRGHMGEHVRGHMQSDMREHMQGFGRDMMMDPPRGPRPEGQPGLGGRPQPFGEMNAPLGPAVPPQAVAGLAAEVLGLQPSEIMEQIRAGRTLAEIAGERGISAEALADQLANRMEQMRVQRTREGIRHMLDQQFPTPPRGPAPE